MDDLPTERTASTLRRALEQQRDREPHHALDRPPGPFRLAGALVPRPPAPPDRTPEPVPSDYFLG